ncbi:MAG: DUF4093 domain-containing protein [Clostridia bacterium]|nr:DUF4093 domain-containing protein [Clostridia bacterium]
MEKLKIPYPIIVEGKYDKIKLSSVIDAEIFTTDGFGIFRENEKTALFKALCQKTKVIVLTDSDGGGRVIRNFFNSCFDKDRIIHLYIPQIKGKEKRKPRPSKEGVLGVEGMETELLKNLFSSFAGAMERKNKTCVTKNELYEMGLSGRDESAKKRAELARKLGFPEDMTANALLSAINILYNREEFIAICSELSNDVTLKP